VCKSLPKIGIVNFEAGLLVLFCPAADCIEIQSQRLVPHRPIAQETGDHCFIARSN